MSERWGSMTWEEARRLDPSKTIAVLPVGAIEAHGPHLPLDTDVIIARAMAEAGAARLRAEGVAAVVLPSFPWAAAPFAAAFPGTISFAPATTIAFVLDLAGSLSRAGVRMLTIANSHFDPAHVRALHEAVERARHELGLRIAYPDLTRRSFAQRLGEEFMSGACHAGRYETSIVMAARPELVREEARRALPANPRSLSDAIRQGRNTFEEAGGPQAYFGFPAEASAEEGERTIEILGVILAEAVLAELDPARSIP